jgi:hypothetical protein
VRDAVPGISNQADSSSSLIDGDIISESLINVTNQSIDVIYIITPSYTADTICDGIPFELIVTVYPLPEINSPDTVLTCSEVAFSYQIASNVPGSIYVWDRPAVVGISNPTIQNNIVNPIIETLINTTNNTIIVSYIITPTGPGTTFCEGEAFTLNVMVFPKPKIEDLPDTVFVCENTPFSYQLNSTVPGSQYTWWRPAIPGIANDPISGTGPLISDTLLNQLQQDIVVIYYIDITAPPGMNNCKSNTQQLFVSVEPEILLDLNKDIVCLHKDEHIFLDADNALIFGLEYLWSTGETTQAIDYFLDHVYEQTVSITVYPKACPVKTDEVKFELCIIDVPNAFSPNGDNVNDILYVEGHGVAKMSFKLYNRWGELVFETDNLTYG